MTFRYVYTLHILYVWFIWAVADIKGTHTLKTLNYLQNCAQKTNRCESVGHRQNCAYKYVQGEMRIHFINDSFFLRRAYYV